MKRRKKTTRDNQDNQDGNEPVVEKETESARGTVGDSKKKKKKESGNPHSGDVEDKYWAQRYRLFSRFDEGVQMDAEGWFSVAPERISEHVARRCWARLQSLRQSKQGPKGGQGGLLIYDAFCGCGGSAIQFALAGFRVLATDIDPIKLACARHNAALYGVLGRIEFVLSDCRTILGRGGRLGSAVGSVSTDFVFKKSTNSCHESTDSRDRVCTRAIGTSFCFCHPPRPSMGRAELHGKCTRSLRLSSHHGPMRWCRALWNGSGNYK